MRSFNKKPHEPYDRCIAFCTVTSLPAPCASSPPCRSVTALPQPKNPSNSPTKARAEKPAHSPQRRHTQGAPGQRSEDAGNHSFSKERYGLTGGRGGHRPWGRPRAAGLRHRGRRRWGYGSQGWKRGGMRCRRCAVPDRPRRLCPPPRRPRKLSPRRCRSTARCEHAQSPQRHR